MHSRYPSPASVVASLVVAIEDGARERLNADRRHRTLEPFVADDACDLFDDVGRDCDIAAPPRRGDGKRRRPRSSTSKPSDASARMTAASSSVNPSSRCTSCLGSTIVAPADNGCPYGVGARTVPPSAASNTAARAAPRSLNAGGRFFSLRVEASVRKPSLTLMRRMRGPVQFALSITISRVVSLTSLIRPPIKPARPVACASSAISSAVASSARSTPSSVVRCSPGLASRTMMWAPAIFS